MESFLSALDGNVQIYKNIILAGWINPCRGVKIKHHALEQQIVDDIKSR